MVGVSDVLPIKLTKFSLRACSRREDLVDLF